MTGKCGHATQTVVPAMDVVLCAFEFSPIARTLVPVFWFPSIANKLGMMAGELMGLLG